MEWMRLNLFDSAGGCDSCGVLRAPGLLALKAGRAVNCEWIDVHAERTSGGQDDLHSKSKSI